MPQQFADLRGQTPHFAVVRSRQPVWRQGIKRHTFVGEVEEPRKGRDKLIGFGAQIGIKHRLHNDFHGNAGHRFFQVNDGAGMPARQFLLYAVLHDLGIAFDVAQVEGRLQGLAATLPGGAVAGEDVLAQDVVERAPDHCRLMEGFALRRQHLADKIGMVEKIAGHGTEAKPQQVALARRLFHETQAVPFEIL